jgi:hypothetical protein
MDEFIDTDNLVSLIIAVVIVAFSYWYFKIRNSGTVDVPVTLPPTNQNLNSSAKKPKKNTQKEEVLIFLIV